ncbi:hypothetical protein OQH61_05185 [Helicobacter sp. MIT 21-1697]|uniref:hypothetical protein n=1 Tax=Helicobacter sp. MIT 21-1697 TaxID=2993733 RepID=UPI00224A65DA|nr:hypothetical protein [Helicobacter sp. MIT 21-1697]MCX2717126.1 hypothetical protein [Helicobacter sp. MIT 21-1697]
MRAKIFGILGLSCALVLFSACSTDKKLKIMQEQKQTLESLEASVQQLLSLQEQLNDFEQMQRQLAEVRKITIQVNCDKEAQTQWTLPQEVENMSESEQQKLWQTFAIISQMEKDGELKQINSQVQEFCKVVGEYLALSKMQYIMQELEEKKASMRAKEQSCKSISNQGKRKR